jgi:hypothetical protein
MQEGLLHVDRNIGTDRFPAIDFFRVLISS